MSKSKYNDKKIIVPNKCKTCENYDKKNNKCIKDKCMTDFSTCTEYLTNHKLVMF